MNNWQRKNAFAALAVGDAIGYRFEFVDPPVTKVRQYIQSQSEIFISDDTQMALFGLEGITLALGKDKPLLWGVKEGYKDWYDTQVLRAPRKPRTKLGEEAKMYARRAPGMTCMASMAQVMTMTPVENDSNGCGTVMRLLPFAFLLDKLPYGEVLDLAVEASLMTHQGDEIVDSTAEFLNLARQVMKAEEPQYPLDVVAASKIGNLGEGWSARECLYMGMWAFRNSDSFEHLLELSVTHEGDSDSTAAVAGALWGLEGNAVPDTLTGRLSEGYEINRAVDRFNEIFGMN